MLPRLLLLVSCIYVVQAAFVINAPEGGIDTSDESSNTVRSCGQYECNQHCRRLGYARGVCIGTYCQCRSRLAVIAPQSEDGAKSWVKPNDGGDEPVNNDDNTQNEIVEQEDFNTQEVSSGDNSEAAVALASARACTHAACDRFCRQRGWHWGRCISANVCRCYRIVRTTNDKHARAQNENEVSQAENVNNDVASEDFNTQAVALEDKSEAAVALASARACTHAACDRFCRQRGWHWGRCISANVCRCYRIVRTTSDNDARAQNENEVSQDLNEDDNARNDVASEDFNTQAVALEDKSEAAVALASARACTHAACDRFCRQRGWHWGRCISANVCRCYRIVRTSNDNDAKAQHENEISQDVNEDDNARNDVASEDFNTQEVALEDKSEAAVALASARACTHAACDRFCRQRGWHWGRCISANVCRCYRIVRTTSDNDARAQNENEVSQDLNEDDNARNDVASEDFNTQALEDKSEAAVALASARACTHAACDRFCRQRGWHWGRCISANVCRCYRILRTTSDNNARAQNENEESQADNANNDVASEDFNTQAVALEDKSEAAVALASARACTHAACDRFCRQRGWHWGRCISANVCRCYRIVRTLNDNDAEAQHENEVSQDVNEDDNARNDIASEDFNTQAVALEDKSEAAVALASARACTHAACDRFCRQRGWHWGRCISANVCRCYRIVRTSNDNDAEAQHENEVSQDVNEDDNARNDVASEDFNTQEVALEDKSEAAVALASARACTHAACDRFCRQRGWHWGRCISANVCRCYRIVRALSGDDENEVVQYDDINREQEAPEDNLNEASKFTSTRACNEEICNKNCRALRYDKGICIGSRCQCLGRPIWFKVSEPEVAAASESDCNLRWCEQNCRRIGFPGGACVNGRCKCDILRRIMPKPIPALEIIPLA